MNIRAALLTLLLSLGIVAPVAAQNNGPVGLIVGQTPVIGGTNGQCLSINNSRLNSVACGSGGSGVSSFSAGTTGFTPSTGSTGNVVLNGILNGANGGTGVANTGKTINLGDNLSFPGSFPVTMTATGSTSLVLPTSGTLATVAGTVSTFSAGSTGFTPSTGTPGNVVLGGTLNGASGGTGVSNTGKSITLGGNLITSGAFATTFTITANTNVTFPTTGTLATVGGTTSSFSGGTTGLTPSSPTNGAIVLAGTLTGANGGTGVANTGKTITLGGNMVTSSDITIPTTIATLATNTFTGAQLVPDGTMALPSVAFSGDPDTGMYRPGGNQLALGVGNANVLAFNSTNRYSQGGRANFSAALGALTGGGESTIGILNEYTFTPATDNNGSIFGQRTLMNPSGTGDIPILMTVYGGIIDDRTSGTINLAYADHKYIWLDNAANITNARVFFGHLVNRGSGTISLGILYFAGTTELDTGTGTVGQVIGFATASDMGNATRVGSVTGFQFSGTVAQGNVRGFTSNQAINGNSAYSIYITGTAPNFSLGNWQIGGTANSVPNTALQITPEWAAGGSAFTAVNVNVLNTASNTAGSRLLSLNLSSVLVTDINLFGTITTTGNLVLGGSEIANHPIIDARATWNNGAATFFGIFSDVTNTASGASSQLIRLNVAGNSQFQVSPSGNGVFAGNLQVGTSSIINFASRTRMTSADGDGILRASNAAATDFNRLILGTPDTSGVAIRKSGTTIAFRLGDDSAYTNVEVAFLLAQGFTASKFTGSITAPGAGLGRMYLVAGTITGTAKLVIVAGTSATPSVILDNIGGGF